MAYVCQLHIYRKHQDVYSMVALLFSLLTQSGSVPGRRYRHAMAAGPDGRVFVFGGEDVDSP